MVNAAIKAQVTGYLLTQNYAEGSFVRKGQLLFEIDPRPFQAACDQAMGQLAQAKAQLAQAKAGLLQAQAQLCQRRSQPDRKRSSTRTATFRSPSSKPSRSRIWTTPRRTIIAEGAGGGREGAGGDREGADRGRAGRRDSRRRPRWTRRR